MSSNTEIIDSLYEAYEREGEDGAEEIVESLSEQESYIAMCEICRNCKDKLPGNEDFNDCQDSCDNNIGKLLVENAVYYAERVE